MLICLAGTTESLFVAALFIFNTQKLTKSKKYFRSTKTVTKNIAGCNKNTKFHQAISNVNIKNYGISPTAHWSFEGGNTIFRFSLVSILYPSADRFSAVFQCANYFP